MFGKRCDPGVAEIAESNGMKAMAVVRLCGETVENTASE